MKKVLFLLSLLLLCCAACSDDSHNIIDTPEVIPGEAETNTAEMLVLSEGLFNLNNSTLARYSFERDELNKDYFRSVNSRGLGDTANDMARYGSKIYIVVNVSSQIEVLDAVTGKVIKQIPMLDGEVSRQPRYIAFHKDKAYVCSFDNTVARIDTASLEVEQLITVGRNPDGICVANGKLYVSNSGGLDYPDYDNTVSVVDIDEFKETAKINVGLNPGRIRADGNGYVYVSIRGNNTLDTGNWVRINSHTDAVSMSFNEPVLNFAIYGNLAYTYSFDYSTNTSAFKVYDLLKAEVISENFITDGTEITTPYGIAVNPYSGNVYISDVYNYQVTGDVLCFNPQGELMFRIENVGINPNTFIFSQTASQSGGGTTEPEDEKTAFATRVLEYVPAPGQFINTTTSAYQEGYAASEVLAYATERVQAKSLITLGAYGGYIVVGFDHTIPHISGEYDFKVYGNASSGSSEPGIVMVSKDVNDNGIADDAWYELAGSEYGSAQEIRDYEITYYRPEAVQTDVRWTDNQGNEGVVPVNSYHTQDYYYPVWVSEDQLTFKGARLPDNGVNTSGNNWTQTPFAWGYADNVPNTSEFTQFKIDWAVDATGNPVYLDGIDFVKVYTAVNQVCGWLGETSTEFTTVEDLHFTN